MADSLGQLPQKHIVTKEKSPKVSQFGLFLAYQPYNVYKNYISSQDAFQCSFYPSCANYCFLAIKKQGFIVGFLSTFDRLARCHNKDHLHYQYHKKSGRLYDPV